MIVAGVIFRKLHTTLFFSSTSGSPFPFDPPFLPYLPSFLPSSCPFSSHRITAPRVNDFKVNCRCRRWLNRTPPPGNLPFDSFNLKHVRAVKGTMHDPSEHRRNEIRGRAFRVAFEEANCRRSYLTQRELK